MAVAASTCIRSKKACPTRRCCGRSRCRQVPQAEGLAGRTALRNEPYSPGGGDPVVGDSAIGRDALDADARAACAAELDGGVDQLLEQGIRGFYKAARDAAQTFDLPGGVAVASRAVGELHAGVEVVDFQTVAGGSCGFTEGSGRHGSIEDCRRRVRLQGGGRSLANGGVEGQEEVEDGAVVGGRLAAADAEGTAVALDDFLADPEAEAGAGDSLGGVEGAEEAAAGDGIHAGAGVREGEDDAGLASSPVGAGAEAKEQTAAVRHGVEGIADEVAEDLADFAFKAAERVTETPARLDGDGGVDDAAVVDREYLFGEGNEIDFLRAGSLLVKAKGLAGDGRDAAELDLGGGEVVADLVERGGRASEVEEVGDRLERVVDFVRDRAGEASDSGEFFALDQGLLGLFLLGDLERGGGDASDGAISAYTGK